MKKKIIFIVGPTSVGKTKLSVDIAKDFSGEIISCDSMQIYKEFNIGTAKITEEEVSGINQNLMFLNIKIWQRNILKKFILIITFRFL